MGSAYLFVSHIWEQVIVLNGYGHCNGQNLNIKTSEQMKLSLLSALLGFLLHGAHFPAFAMWLMTVGFIQWSDSF